MSDSYAHAIYREEADDLADQVLATLPDLALPSAHMGVGLAALVVALRRMIETLPEDQREEARRNVAFLVGAKTWRREYP